MSEKPTHLFVMQYYEDSEVIEYYVPQESVVLFEKHRDRIVSHLADVTMLANEGRFPVQRGTPCFHIVPKDDGFDHTTHSMDCCCGITGDWNNKVIIHTALDGRKPFKEAGLGELWEAKQGRM